MMQTYTVSGMTCEHCVGAVSAAVSGVPGVSGVAVDLGTGLVTVEGEPRPEAVRHAITAAGYELA